LIQKEYVGGREEEGGGRREEGGGRSPGRRERCLHRPKREIHQVGGAPTSHQRIQAGQGAGRGWKERERKG
jgi:hypothetical protein